MPKKSTKPKPKKCTITISDTNVATGGISFVVKFSPATANTDTAAVQLAMHVIEAATNYMAEHKNK